MQYRPNKIECLTNMRKETSSWQVPVHFVPTMGALHAGHLKLVEKACEGASDTKGKVVVSIFVNPTQFGPNEDYANYPRTIEQDIAALQSFPVNYIFLPTAAEMYPDQSHTFINTTSPMAGMHCGQYRESHFQGVLTVVMKLINICRADFLYLGKKDYQQLTLLRNMLVDLNHSCKIEPVDTMREESGLAMSSRNQYLSEDERQSAAKINLGLQQIKLRTQEGETDSKALKSLFLQAIESDNNLNVQYINICNRNTLLPVDFLKPGQSVVLTAVFCGNTRLIDNIEI